MPTAHHLAENVTTSMMMGFITTFFTNKNNLFYNNS